MYRHIVKAHGKFAFQDVSKLNLSEAGKKDYLKMQARQVLIFNTIGAVLVVGSLYVISNTIMDQIRNKNINNVNTTGPQDPKVETSCAKAISIFMFTFFRKIKGPNWFKYLILFLILLFGLYFLISYFPRLATAQAQYFIFISIYKCFLGKTCFSVNNFSCYFI